MQTTNLEFSILHHSHAPRFASHSLCDRNQPLTPLPRTIQIQDRVGKARCRAQFSVVGETPNEVRMDSFSGGHELLREILSQSPTIPCRSESTQTHIHKCLNNNQREKQSSFPGAMRSCFSTRAYSIESLCTRANLETGVELSPDITIYQLPQSPLVTQFQKRPSMTLKSLSQDVRFSL